MIYEWMIRKYKKWIAKNLEHNKRYRKHIKRLEEYVERNKTR